MYVLQDLYHARDQCVENVSYCTCSTCFQSLCTLQSSEATVAVTESQQEIASFVDANNEMVETISAVSTRADSSAAQTVGELKDFLKRPVRIADYSWLEATAAGYVSDFAPWKLYLNAAQVRNKLDNYTWFRGTLHLKFVVTASPFYYGLLMASYCPLPDYVDAAAGTGTFSYMLRSQRPHVMITAADSKGGEIEIPFIYPQHYVNIKSASDVEDLGVMSWQIISPLRSANGTTGTGVSVQVYAWMENAELQGPTVGLSLQSNEYTEPGAVSSIASAVAGVASKFTTWPFVGKFARATEIGAGALSSVASIFGFTNVPVLEAAIPVRSSPFPQLASTEIGYPVEKLTVDPKNELSVDGAAVSLELDDDLQISSFVQRESILITSTFETSDLVDAQLFRMAVTPNLWNREVATSHYINYLTPVAFASQPFEFWRGDIIVRFDFIKSKYHRGRVIATWEPNATAGANVSTTQDAMGQAITKVLDLGAESSMEIRIPYNQARPWLRLSNAYEDCFTRRGSNINEAGYDPNNHNGLLVVRVLNVLTAPVATSTVDFVVSIRGAENLEFANPTKLPEWSRFAVQSKVFEQPAQQEEMGKVAGTTDELYMSTMGEAVRSFRTLLRRSVLSEVSVVPTDTTNELALAWWRRTRFPPMPGYVTNGLHAAASYDGTTSVPYNWTKMTLFNLLAPCFVGVRGSMMWHFNAINQSATGNTPTPVRVVRSPQHTTVANGVITLATKTGANDARFYALNVDPEFPGAALTTTTTNQGLSVSVPNCTNALFQTTRPEASNTPSTEGLIPDTDLFTLEVSYTPKNGQTTRCAYVEKYVAAGTDLSLVYFINVPRWYQYRFTPSYPPV